MNRLATLAAFVPIVAAHGFIRSPAPRQPGDAFKAACGDQPFYQQSSDINGNVQGILQVVGNSFDDSNCNLWLCKGFQYEDNTANVHSYTLGETIDFDINIAAPHTGIANVSVVKTSTNSIIGTPLIEFDNYAANAGVAANNSAFSVTLPADLEGECTTAGDCVLQWYWDAADINQTYESCVDFTVGGSGNTPTEPETPSSSAAPSAAPTPAPSSVSEAAPAPTSATEVITSEIVPTPTSAPEPEQPEQPGEGDDEEDDECPADDDDEEELPEDGEDDECPADEEDDELPEEGEDDECPADEEDDELPEEGEDDECPADEEDDELPEEGEDDECPADEDEEEGDYEDEPEASNSAAPAPAPSVTNKVVVPTTQANARPTTFSTIIREVTVTKEGPTVTVTAPGSPECTTV
ncbi:hypothetical protein HJFPF1_02626 [Paramyrothecium foliicola]|nr:hypothetical protein HJFPF1_02626 [Paramyrothecium foliicola]